MTKHTAAPWTNHKWNSQEHQISALGGTVALVSHDHSLISDEQADANAHLIAAAPELLAACQSIMEFLSNGTPVNSGSLVQADVFNAIRKATGQ